MGTRDAGFDESRSMEKHSLDKDDAMAVSTKVVDTAAELVSGDYAELDPVEARRIRSVFPSTGPIICCHSKYLDNSGGRSICTSFLSCAVRTVVSLP